MPASSTGNLHATDFRRRGGRPRGREYNGPVNDLERDLRRVVRGSVRFDPASLLLYSTDASMYQVEPLGIVTPRDPDDVMAAFDVARRQQVALLPRGGGTSLTGQTVNRALVLDFSRHMNGVLEVNADELWARVQPGLVQDELNHHVRGLGLLFGPDTSTSNRATLGWMICNNSVCSHSIAYGLTVEHVLELDALLADGTRVRFGTLTPAEFEAKSRLEGAEGRIYREVAAIRAEYAEEIRKRYPKHWRRVAGYNLNELVKPGNLNMARVLVGSEATLLTVLQAKARLVRRPRKTALDVIHYASIQEALESSQSILETGPYAVELTDKLILDLARNNIEQRARMGFVQGDPGAILIVEYAGETDAEVTSKVEALEARRARESFGYAAHVAHDVGEQQSIRRLKTTFDPDNRMNPGNIVDSPGIIENLRYGVAYKTWEPRTLLDFSAQGGFAAAVEMCNGVGVCRKKLEGTMCPSYMATKDEEHSTRGRANALRAVLSGRLPAREFTGKRLHAVMDLCLECKGCKAECPANVDMAKLKYEFLYHYYQANGLPLRNRVFGRVAKLSALGARTPRLSNAFNALPPVRWLLEKIVGIDRRRPLPALATETFEDWFRGHAPPASAPRGEVVLFHDTFVSYNTPEIGHAAVRLLEGAGYRVVLVDRKCCGRPLISKGMLDEAREHAAWNVARPVPYARRGVAIVGLEPSCSLTLRDEWVDLLRTDDARAVAEQSLLLEQFLLRERERGLTLRFADGHGRKVLLHGHCHQKAMVGTAPTVAVLTWAGYDVSEVDSGCCGMAGSFGFEREHYDLSVALGNRRLAPAVKAADPHTLVVAPGISCRQQIQHLAGRRAKHPAEALAEALDR